MALIKHDTAKRHVATRRLDLFDRFFDDWSDLFRRPVPFWPGRGIDSMHVEEFSEDGILVIRMEIAGIDPEKDVDISVTGDTLHVSAERREEEKGGSGACRGEVPISHARRCDVVTRVEVWRTSGAARYLKRAPTVTRHNLLVTHHNDRAVRVSDAVFTH